MKLLVIFIILNIINVIMQTVRSITTVKCGKVTASLMSAISYGLYTVVLVYMTCDLNIYVKALVVAVCNLIGVYIVKLLEEKSRKDKIWKIDVTIDHKNYNYIVESFNKFNIPYLALEVNNCGYDRFEIYSYTQKDSGMIKELLEAYEAKYFVTESKAL